MGHTLSASTGITLLFLCRLLLTGVLSFALANMPLGTAVFVRGLV